MPACFQLQKGVKTYPKKASNMEAAYGLAITVTMIATSILFANFLVNRRTKPVLIYLYLIVYLTIEFIVLEKYLSQDNDLPIWERMMMQLHFSLKEVSLSEERGFGLDPGNVTVEKFPLIVSPVTSLKLKRIHD